MLVATQILKLKTEGQHSMNIKYLGGTFEEKNYQHVDQKFVLQFQDALHVDDLNGGTTLQQPINFL